MKKLLALLLAIVCAFSLVACGGQEEATKVAEGFLTELCEFDVEGMTPYFETPEKAAEFTKDISYESLMEQFPAELDGFDSEMKTLIDKMFAKLSENISTEITDVQKTKGGYVFAVNAKIPDFENIDFEKTFADSIDQKELENQIMDMVLKGELSLSSSQEDIMEKLIPILFEKVDEALANVEFDFVEEETALKVLKKDGRWVISTEDAFLFKK